MQSLFSPDSKIMQTLNRLCDLVILNVVYLVTCLPIVTIGAANTALYTVCFRFRDNLDGHFISVYFRAFRENFKQGTLLWGILLLLGVAAGFGIFVFSCLDGIWHYGIYLYTLLLALVVMTASYAFPLLSQFSNTTKTTLTNAFALSMGYLPRSLVIAVLNLLPWALLLVNFYVFIQASLAWLFVYFSTAAYITTFLLKKVFAPYFPGEEPLKTE